MGIVREISNQDVLKAQTDNDYYWMMNHWNRKGINCPPTHALRNYSFREYLRIKQVCKEQVEASGKTNDSTYHRKIKWHNCTVFLHLIVTHPLYMAEEHTKHDRNQLKLPSIVQQLAEVV